MEKYQYKCSCGQPYSVEEEGHYPMKDEFHRNCPSCSNDLKYKGTCMSTEWTFDPEFKKQEA